MKNRKSRARRKPAPLPLTGDHGPNTAAATAGTVLEAVEGEEHNRTGRRRRVDAIEQINLTMRQGQAAKRIRDAYSRVESLSSGGPLKEQVDSSPKPDQAVAVQVDAQSELAFVMGAVPPAMRGVVEHVCWHNRAIEDMGNELEIGGNTACLKVALHLVANSLRY